MSLRPANSRPARSTSKILASLSLIAVGMTFAAPSVSAGGGTNLDWSLESKYLGGDCVQILGKNVLTDTAAMPALVEPGDPDGEVELLFPTGSYTDGTPAVVEVRWDQRFIEAGQGFYLMGFRFVESCDDVWAVEPFEPCFSVSSTYGAPIEPWILSFVPGEYLLFFFDLEQTAATISIQVGLDENDCNSEEPGNGSSQIGELLEVIDELDLELPFDADPRPSYNIDIDHYRRMAAAQEENALPSTL